MKIIHKEFSKGIIKIKVENLNDLWFLSNLVEKGDLVKGKSERKIKLGGEKDRARTVKKTVVLTVKVENVDFQKQSNVLRISGIVDEGSEYVPKGSHHTIDVEPNDIIAITKETWLGYQLEKINEACSTKYENVLVVAFDREEAIIALLKGVSYDVLLRIKGEVSKKGFETKKDEFYKEIISKMLEYKKRYNIKNIVVASPAFWKEYLMKEVPEELKKSIILATCSSVDETGLNELLKRPELKTVLEKDKTAREAKLVEELLKNIANENAFYGIKEAKKRIEIGNVKFLFITENFLQKSKEEGKYGELNALMKSSENVDAEIHIFSSEDACKRIDSLGGIAGILRWKDY